MRIVATGDGAPRRAVADREGTMPGRGAYLCRDGDRDGDGATPASACLIRATQRGGISRALRAAVTFDPKLVESVSR